MPKLPDGVKRLHTQGSGLCRVGDSVFFYIQSADETYFLPVQSSKDMDPYHRELKAFLVLKYGEEVAEAFLADIQKAGQPAADYFLDDSGELDRFYVISEVDTFLRSSAKA